MPLAPIKGARGLAVPEPGGCSAGFGGRPPKPRGALQNMEIADEGDHVMAPLDETPEDESASQAIKKARRRGLIAIWRQVASLVTQLLRTGPARPVQRQRHNRPRPRR